MTIREIKAKAKEAIKGNRGNLLVSQLFIETLCCIPVLGTILLSPFRIGFVEMNRDCLNGTRCDIKSLYADYRKRIGPAYLAAFLFGIYVLVATLVLVLVYMILFALFTRVNGGFGTFLMILWVMLLIVGLVVYIYLMEFIQCTTMYILSAVPEADGDEAFKKGRTIAKANVGRYIGLCISYIGNILLGIITLGLYMVYFMPEFSLATVALIEDACKEAE